MQNTKETSKDVSAEGWHDMRLSIQLPSVSGVDSKLGLTRFMVMPSLMAARWMGHNTSPIFRRLWTKVYQIKLPVRECPEFATPFSDWQYLVAFRRYSSKFLTEFYKTGWPSNMWWRLMMIGQATSDISSETIIKKDLNDSGKTEWPTASIASGLI